MMFIKYYSAVYLGHKCTYWPLSNSHADSVSDLPPIANITGEENCGISGYDGEGCELSYQPCFYNVTVVTVYKGNLTVS